ncbi:hypothetical protein [Brevibacillus parabrevis]|nr:hypothetical protein [Brevibacillus parabrevis]
MKKAIAMIFLSLTLFVSAHYLPGDQVNPPSNTVVQRVVDPGY